MENLEIRKISSNEEVEAYRAFRYRVDVEEFNYSSPNANAETVKIEDPWDYESSITTVFSNDEIVGCTRMTAVDTLASHISVDQLIGPVPDDIAGGRISYASAAALDRNWRSAGVLGQLFSECYMELLTDGVALSYCVALPSLVSLYERLGYRRYRENVFLPGYGYRVPMVLVVHDAAYLERIGSSFLRVFRRSGKPSAHEDWFADHYPHYDRLYNDKGHIGEFTRKRTHNFGFRDSSVFHGMSPDEIDRFIGGLVPLTLQTSDTLITPGPRSDDLYLIVNGYLCAYRRIEDKDMPVAVMGDGDLVGELGFLCGGERSGKVIAAAKTEVLPISRKTVEGIARKDPELAVRFLFNLGRLVGDRFGYRRPEVLAA